MRNAKVGVVGLGFVGSALIKGLKKKEYFNAIHTYDKYKNSSCESLKELCKQTELIFVCVPTPMKTADGGANVSYVRDTILEIDSYKKNHIVVIKSTVPPGTTKLIQKLCTNCSIVFSPEFLTEANFLNDFLNQDRIVLGGSWSAKHAVKDFFQKGWQEGASITGRVGTKYLLTDSTTAEMVKYFANCFLATKVTFANEMHNLCETVGVDYGEVVHIATHDRRINNSHFEVPGPDGGFGFSGSCFPKDLCALLELLNLHGLTAPMLNGVWESNLLSRPERDWEKLKGRAITDEEK